MKVCLGTVVNSLVLRMYGWAVGLQRGLWRRQPLLMDVNGHFGTLGCHTWHTNATIACNLAGHFTLQTMGLVGYSKLHFLKAATQCNHQP